MKHENNLWYLMKDTASEMERLGYSPGSMKHYWEVWKKHFKFTNMDAVNRPDMDHFLTDTYRIDNTTKSTRYQRSALRAMNVLEHYANTGRIYIRFPLINPVAVDTGMAPVILLIKETKDYRDRIIPLSASYLLRWLESLG